MRYVKRSTLFVRDSRQGLRKRGGVRYEGLQTMEVPHEQTMGVLPLLFPAVRTHVILLPRLQLFPLLLSVSVSVPFHLNRICTAAHPIEPNRPICMFGTTCICLRISHHTKLKMAPRELFRCDGESLNFAPVNLKKRCFPCLSIGSYLGSARLAGRGL